MISKKSISVLVILCAFLVGMTFASSGVLFAQETAKVVQLNIAGNQNINTDVIRNSVVAKVGDAYEEQAIEKDRVAIMGLGYFSAVTVRKDEVPGGYIITYEVIENSKINDIKIEGSEPIPSSKILELMKMKSGLVLNVNTLNKDIETIQDYYRDEGYFAYVTEDIGVDTKTGVLTIPILVNRVESVRIAGNVKTKEFVFLREMKTQPGVIFNIKTLKSDIVKIFGLDVLEDIKPYQILPGDKMGTVKVIINVVEKKTGQVSLGLGYSSKQRLVGQVRVTETNFRGNGQGLNALWEQGTSEAVGGSSSYELGFYEPWLDKRHTSLSLNVFNKIQYRFSSGVFSGSALSDEKTYNERRKGGEITLSRPLSENTRLYLGSRFENVDTDPALLTSTGDLAKIVQKGDVLSGSLRIVNESRDFPMDPAAGQYDSASIEIGTVNSVRFGASPTFNEIPFDGTFSKYSVDLRRYYSKGGAKTAPKDKRKTIALRLKMGFGNGKLPFFEQFFVGGGESLRGYTEDRFWGTKMLLASVEYRMPLGDSVSLVLPFVDYGDAWDSSENFTIGELSQHNDFKGNFGVGFGIRVNTPIGNLRLDYGTGSEGGRSHFSIGQAF